ncbi:MAG TPA: TIGR01777 family oxidoreductase, partial [Opitutaceae bacterium]|nr:TIGR01777 family oxidoreductase [Opitutaceae bacterium]
MRIVVVGASGLIGRALVPFLQTQGHEVIRLVRGRRAAGVNEIGWDPNRRELDSVSLDGVDAIINLAGENVAGGRWTPQRRDRILRSRVDPTATLVAAMGAMSPRPAAFVNAAAVGYYGDRGDEILDESSSTGTGFLPEVCLAWETHAEGAARLGVRTALLRFGIVLTPAGGALRKMLPVFRAGLGGRFGSGQQWMSWVSVDDAIGAIYHAVVENRCEGAINVVSPEPVTNAAFAKTLAGVLDRAAVVPVPALALHAWFGRMADETLLGSTRAIPARLDAIGYGFRH